ncbi:hypothetical protein TRFO_12314 [Tritrichomonas foetus]|uniref:Peptidase S8/S53 domain-containing protein n=1 Tax=Tritrichomonas foetus TaxID=1144522 RepID=A0A1J4IZB8_9EUKA|nr:hypothetical protein TRFO_12314 [Tritrichomonas foetus]|eukprot:OHS92758.1 hypothetical protein TRFO_12314 [Tritrichomonas foetus]
MSVAEHGTHVSGTVAGEAHDDSDWKHYNGIAPKTKLAFYQAKKNGVYLATNISDIARETNATACTNSWGYRYFSAEIDNTWDITALNHSECLYIFAAGNAGDSYYPNLDYYMTINTPGSAKNIFTIGALDSIPIDEPPNSDPLKHVYAYNYANSDTYELLLKEWSIGDSNTNPGLKAIFENAQYNFYMANESENLKEGMMMVVYSKEAFMALNRTNPPLAVLTSENFEIDNFSALGFTQPFPVFYLEYELVKALYEAYKLEPQVRLIANYMKYTGKEPKRAPFSSKGPSNLGIMKPDIVTPGVTVFSARSDPNGGGGHGGTTIMQGTSMASPNAAGSAALVGQYYQDGKYKNMKFRPSGMLVRATLINAADPVDTIYPNAQTGFGKLNLCNYIMSEGGDDDKIFIGDRLKVGDNQHIFFEIEVTSNDRDLRVTLSYLDAVTNPDSQIALLIDLDLVVIAPDGKTVYRGNQRVDGSEEQYSTNERVLIPKENVTVGKYEIHIFSHVPEIVEDRTAEFSIVVFGSLKTTAKTISFQKATKCIPVVEKHGVCDKETTRNVCNRNFDDTYEGHSCQSYVISYDPELGRHPISIPPFGIQYINMLCPIDGEFEEITYRIVPATYFNPKFATIFNYTQDTDFKVRESSADSVEADIELVQRIVNEGQIEPWTDQSCLYTMVYNKSPYETKLAITSEIIREPTPTRGPRPTETPLPKVQTGFSEVAFYGVLTAAVIFFAATVTLLVLLVVKIKKQSNYHDVDSTSVKVTNQSFLA